MKTKRMNKAVAKLDNEALRAEIPLLVFDDRSENGVPDAIEGRPFFLVDAQQNFFLRGEKQQEVVNRNRRVGSAEERANRDTATLFFALVSMLSVRTYDKLFMCMQSFDGMSIEEQTTRLSALTDEVLRSSINGVVEEAQWNALGQTSFVGSSPYVDGQRIEPSVMKVCMGGRRISLVDEIA